MALSRYSSKEIQVFFWVIVPYVIGMNSIVLGECVFSGIWVFAASFFLSALYLFTVYFFFGQVAVLIQKRFPANNELFKRIGVMLPIFCLMNILLVSGLFSYCEFVQPFNCSPNLDNFGWAYAFACISSIVITFLNEAIVNWDKWKNSVTETEQLKNAYQKTKLLGLKGQINPHFLFNCFNSLSSLINEDEQKAEQFLDEMTKVHRYMLRGDDDQLVTLEQELKFARSYLYLTDVRFGQAIKATINVDDKLLSKYLPPLSLQAILENIIYTNTASKSHPLSLEISSDDDDTILIRNSVQSRIRKDASNFEEGLDNLITKYKLLQVSDVTVHECETERTIVLPLLDKKEVAV